MTERKPQLGEGIYTFPEAAAILRLAGIQSGGASVSPRQLHYWIGKGLAEPIPWDEDFAVLSFDDLVSLELVRRFKSVGASLQKVRTFNAALRHAYPALDHPFAYKIFFSDGATIWAQVEGTEPPTVVELTGKRRNQYAWREAIQTFAKAIRWSTDQPAHAEGWMLSPWVEIDPDIQFGAPIIRGSRVTASTIAANLREGSPDEVADWYGLDVQSVVGARDYLALV